MENKMIILNHNACVQQGRLHHEVHAERGEIHANPFFWGQY